MEMEKVQYPLKRVESQLLALIRASLWQRPVEEAAFKSEAVDWPAIGRLAIQQTVGPMVFEAALSLPPALRPPKEWVAKALAFLETNRRTHALVDRSVAESMCRLAEEGLDTVLLKGQAYARAYPRSELRQCGDIDLYVGEENYYRAYETIKSFGWDEDEKFNPQAKHFECRLNGVEIELHQKASILPSKQTDRKFKQWCVTHVSLSDRKESIGGSDVRVPTPVFDVVFVFLHLYFHFLNSGIGLRHVCDWAMLLHARAKDIDRDELEQVLKEFRLMNAWETLAPILVHRLGLPESECPFYSERYLGRAERALRAILKEGNFGSVVRSGKTGPKGYFAWKLYSFRRQSLNYIRKSWIDPGTIAQIYGRYVSTGVSYIINDKFKRK